MGCGMASSLRDLLGRMLAQGLDGVILATASKKDLLLPMLRAARVPVVLVNRVDASGGCPAVISDDRAGMAQSVDHLAALGHRHIAHHPAAARIHRPQFDCPNI